MVVIISKLLKFCQRTISCPMRDMEFSGCICLQLVVLLMNADKSIFFDIALEEESKEDKSHCVSLIQRSTE